MEESMIDKIILFKNLCNDRVIRETHDEMCKLYIMGKLKEIHIKKNKEIKFIYDYETEVLLKCMRRNLYNYIKIKYKDLIREE